MTTFIAQVHYLTYFYFLVILYLHKFVSKLKKKKTEYGASTGFYFVFLLVFQIYEGVLCYILI